MTEEYQNFLIEQVKQGLDDIENGRVISLEESRQLCQKTIYETVQELQGAVYA
ncbi:TPA: hypothetical protein RSV43_002261 [Mannheimia haemolytica]|nr:hypothetical protein [Mannheimia haemolytica]HDZ3584623.1 hypothetical protein [Mannheimia haemolytica]